MRVLLGVALVLTAALAAEVRPVVLGPAEHPLVLLTSSRRDLVSPALDRLRRGATALAPAAERASFENVTAFWDRYREARFHDYAATSTRVLTEPLTALRYVKGGDRVSWHGTEVEVLDTPGMTGGGVSYAFARNGEPVIAVGDLIFGDGQILDLYSLQYAVPGTNVRGYHGYAARAAQVIASLRLIRQRNPARLIPARGPEITQPAAAIDKLTARLEAVFRPYFQTDALRWYWGEENLKTRARGILGERLPPWMEMAPRMAKGEPSWYIPIRTSRLLISSSGAALLIDCGYRETIDEVKRLQREGRFRKLEAIYLTHYHDDHTDFIQTAAEEFGVPVWHDASSRAIYERPGDFKMPALTARPLLAGEPMRNGQSRQWHEFRLTNYFFPGQTLYHGALLVEERSGRRILFAGDSFTPSGIDDYCLWNRNLLRDEEGYFYCLRLLRELGLPWIVNEHVDEPFRFSSSQLEFMEGALRERRSAIAALTPFDHANYAVDEQWARFFPYAVRGKAGQPLRAGFRITNHSPERQTYIVTPRLPEGWAISPRATRLTIAPGKEETAEFVIEAKTGRGVITADVQFGPWLLAEFAELLIDSEP